MKISSSDPDASLNVILNHFGSDPDYKERALGYLLNAYETNHSLLTSYGYTLVSPQETIDLSYIETNSNSIYHYHGSCEIGTIVDNNLKVNNTNNLYVGDISVLDKPWGGSKGSCIGYWI